MESLIHFDVQLIMWRRAINPSLFLFVVLSGYEIENNFECADVFHVLNVFDVFEVQYNCVHWKQIPSK